MQFSLKINDNILHKPSFRGKITIFYKTPTLSLDGYALEK